MYARCYTIESVENLYLDFESAHSVADVGGEGVEAAVSTDITSERLDIIERITTLLYYEALT